MVEAEGGRRKLLTELPLPPACGLLFCSDALLVISAQLVSACCCCVLLLALCCYWLNPERLAAPRHRANFAPPHQLRATAPTAPPAGAAPMRAAMPVV